MFYKAEIHLGFCGMDTEVYFQAVSQKDAEECTRELAIAHAESYGFEQNEDVFGDYDTIGRDFDEDLEEYEEVGSLDYSVEEVSQEEYEDNVL